MGLRRLGYTGALYAGSAALLLLCGVPLAWMLYTSLKPAGDLFTYPPQFFGNYSLANFRRLVGETYFMTYFVNSVIVAGVTVTLDIVIATLGAYSLTRFRYPGRFMFHAHQSEFAELGWMGMFEAVEARRDT